MYFKIWFTNAVQTKIKHVNLMISREFANMTKQIENLRKYQTSVCFFQNNKLGLEVRPLSIHCNNKFQYTVCEPL